MHKTGTASNAATDPEPLVAFFGPTFGRLAENPEAEKVGPNGPHEAGNRSKAFVWRSVSRRWNEKPRRQATNYTVSDKTTDITDNGDSQSRHPAWKWMRNRHVREQQTHSPPPRRHLTSVPLWRLDKDNRAGSSLLLLTIPSR